MTQVKELAKDFVTSQFGARETFFETAWGLVSRHYDNLVAQPTREQGLRTLGRPLGIAGPEASEAVKWVVIFVGLEREAIHTADPKALIQTLRALCEHWEAGHTPADNAIVRLESVLDAAGRNGWAGGGASGSRTTEETYARLWSNTPKCDGLAIGRDRFDELLPQRKRFSIFAIDRGDFELRRVGEIYLDGVPAFHRRPGQAQQRRGHLTPLEYRLLVYTLQNWQNDSARHLSDLVRRCWPRTDRNDRNVEQLLAYRKIDDSFGYERIAKNYRKTTTRLSLFLKARLNIEYRTGGTGVYGLTTWLPFCIIQTV